MSTLLNTKVWRLLRSRGPCSPAELCGELKHRWRVVSRAAIRHALHALVEQGCVVCTGATRSRECEVTGRRPSDQRGRAAGSAIGRAMAAEITRQEAYREFGIVPKGTALERFWPIFGGPGVEVPTDDDDGGMRGA